MSFYRKIFQILQTNLLVTGLAKISGGNIDALDHVLFHTDKISLFALFKLIQSLLITNPLILDFLGQYVCLCPDRDAHLLKVDQAVDFVFDLLDF